MFFDLETLPDMEEAMKVWPQLDRYPGSTFKASIQSIICFGYWIYGEDEPKVICAWDFPEWEQNVNDDGPLIRAAAEVLRNADCIVTQNGKKFDEKFFQTRLLIKDQEPLPKIPHVDTRQIAKSKLLFFSNSLKHMAEMLNVSRKKENEGWDLWVKVRKRDPEAMVVMKDYCMHDVIATKEIFTKLKRFSNEIPNYNQFIQGDMLMCPNCGSTRLEPKDVRRTKTMVYKRYRCQDCLSYSRTDLSGRLPRTY